MLPRLLPLLFAVFVVTSVFAEKKFTVLKDFRSEWLKYEEGAYQPAGASITGLSTLYFELAPDTYPGTFLRLKSDRPYFLFINGKIRGEYRGETRLDVDSLASAIYARQYWVAIHQDNINGRDLHAEIISTQAAAPSESENTMRPYSHFRDFVVVAGLFILLLFLFELRMNPKLAADYFSISRLIASREADDSQASARLTSGANVQFYVFCSLMMSFYLLIILYNLPPEYALPVRFHATGFWMISWQWLKLASVIFLFFMSKLLIVFCMTRLFGMWGMARFHFFNWMRLLLVVFSLAAALLFMYFISRGESPRVFVFFLFVIVAALMAWIVMAFFKLGGRSGHSMFHLFSYLCATEIIPLFITVKVLFQ